MNISEPLPYCMNNTEMDLSSKDSVIFWLEGVALTVISIVGIVGNILTCVVLAKISLNNVFNQLIVILCALDTVFNAFCIVEYALKKAFAFISYATPIYVDLWPKFIYPLMNITYSASLSITLAIAIERYLAVCHPFLVHQDPTTVGSNGNMFLSFKKRTCRYLLPALIFAITINVTKFMEFRTYFKEGGGKYIQPTNLRMDQNYQLYYIHWTRMLLTAFGPFVLLTYLNGRIIHQIVKAEKISAQRDATMASKREAKLARILVLLVGCFLVCNLGKLVLNLYDVAHMNRLRECLDLGLVFVSPRWFKVLLSINHLMMVANASTNLFLFSLIGTQFRATLLAILHLRPSPQGRPNISYSLHNGSPTVTQRHYHNHTAVSDANEASAFLNTTV